MMARYQLGKGKPPRKHLGTWRQELPSLASELRGSGGSTGPALGKRRQAGSVRCGEAALRERHVWSVGVSFLFLVKNGTAPPKHSLQAVYVWARVLSVRAEIVSRPMRRGPKNRRFDLRFTGETAGARGPGPGGAAPSPPAGRRFRIRFRTQSLPRRQWDRSWRVFRPQPVFCRCVERGSQGHAVAV